MNATITYEMQNLKNPFDKDRQQEMVWCLVKVTTPQFGEAVHEPVALFNLDREAVTFQGHVVASGLEGKLISITARMKEFFTRW